MPEDGTGHTHKSNKLESKCDFSPLQRDVALAVLRSLCASSVRTWSALSENFIFLLLSAISATVMFVAGGHIFMLPPGQFVI